MIYVTHDQVEAMTLATKIVVMRDGRIEQVGSPLHLYDDPDNLFVAGFIGSPKMNFLTACRRGGHLVIPDCDGQVIRCPDLGSAIADGAEGTVGLRPQFIGRDGDQALDLTIEIVEHFGSDSLVHARSAGSDRLVTALVENGRDLGSGQRLEARFRTEDLLFFDQDGLRIR
jgi:lactose/L-arabinose transport system ATP-binding protein